MKTNVGNLDKTIRVIAAIIVAILVYSDVLNGVPAIILSVVAIVLVLTSMVSICPLYLALGINTKGRKK
ncbi:MAG: DUF2892 domain-containing protein [Bacteroidales bacterium]|nr:DUF2892 domain-containing protein [Bacteroidales bacterium]